MLSEETLAPSAGCSVLGCPQVLQWQETRAHRAHLNASADVVHDLDGPAVLVAREGLGKSGDLHPPFGLGPRFLPVDGLTGGALQAAVLQVGGGKKAGIRAPQPHHQDAGHAELVVLGQLGTLLPLEYMASTQSMWKECWQLVRRPTISGLIVLHSHASP